MSYFPSQTNSSEPPCQELASQPLLNSYSAPFDQDSTQSSDARGTKPSETQSSASSESGFWKHPEESAHGKNESHESSDETDQQTRISDPPLQGNRKKAQKKDDVSTPFPTKASQSFQGFRPTYPRLTERRRTQADAGTNQHSRERSTAPSIDTPRYHT